MSEEKAEPKAEEQNLVKLYTELTGASETSGRAVFMHIKDAEPEKSAEKAPPAEVKSPAANPPA